MIDQQSEQRVRAALHEATYLDDRHLQVSVEGGAVVLRGFVFTDSELQEVLRIARRTSGGRPVVDNLFIQKGGVLP